VNLLKVQAMQRGGVSEEEVQGMLGEVEKQVLSDRQFRLQQARWCRGGRSALAEEEEAPGTPGLTSIEQQARSLQAPRPAPPAPLQPGTWRAVRARAWRAARPGGR
jgi:hypothetical protein